MALLASDPNNVEFYQQMFTILLEQPQYLTQLSQLIDHGDHETMAQIVVHLTTPFGRLTQHMRSLIYAEFEQAPDPSSILRRNSVASRVMAILARRIGPDFLNTYFGDLVRKLVDNETINLEVDPGHVGEDGAAKLTLTELKENKRQLLRFCTKVFNKICSDDVVAAMPREFKAIAFFIAQYARKASPDKVNALIGSFVMLRLFNPMLIAPQAFGLVPKKKVPSARARRNMLLITKVMQNLANGQPFGAKEDYMLDLNPWIEKNKGKMEHYLSLMASDTNAPAPEAAFADLLNPTTRSEIARAGLDIKDLQFLHWLLFSHREALEKHFTQAADFRALLAQLGAPPTLKQSTPLYQAAMEDNVDEMKHLIVHRADLKSTIKSDPEWHPLQWCLDHAKRDEGGHYQLEHRYLELLDLLLHHGLDSRCISKAKGYTPLHKFVRCVWKDRLVHLRVMSCMVLRGRDINFPAVGDETALHVAAQENVDDSLAFLLANGADPNLRNTRGDTALHLAAQNGSVRAVTLLLEAGAQTTLRGSLGKAPKDLAEQFKRAEIAKLFVEQKKIRNVSANARLQPNTGEFVPIAHHLHEPSLSVYTNQEGLHAKSERSVSAPQGQSGKPLPPAPTNSKPAPFHPQRSVRELNWAAADSYYSNPARIKKVVRVQAHARRWLARRYLKIARQRRDQKKTLVENMVVDELHESERAYVRDLTTLIKVFVEPLRFAPKPIVSSDDLKVLFLEVEALQSANQKFLILLGAFPNPRTSLSLTEIFFNLCNFLKAYHNYYRNHPHAMLLLSRLQKNNKEFEAFLQNVALQPDVRYDLKTYLTKPILRASLYPLLLEKMLRKIPATHIEHDGLMGVHAKMKQLVDGLDESLRRSENQIQIADIADRIQHKGDLIAPHRTLLREGDLGVVQSNDKIYRCFLFNDLLLLTVMCKAQSRQSLFGAKKTPKASAQFEVKHQFEMSNATIFDVADMDPSSGFLNAFQMVYQPDSDTVLSYTFLTATPEEKALWMKAFMRCPIRNLARSA